jgi:hypothetical protein
LVDNNPMIASSVIKLKDLDNTTNFSKRINPDEAGLFLRNSPKQHLSAETPKPVCSNLLMPSIRDNAVWTVIEERPCTSAARAAGVRSDRIVWLGGPQSGSVFKQPVRLLAVATGKTDAQGRPEILLLAKAARCSRERPASRSCHSRCARAIWPAYSKRSARSCWAVARSAKKEAMIVPESCGLPPSWC